MEISIDDDMDLIQKIDSPIKNSKHNNTNILNIVTTYAWTGSGFVAPSAAAKGGVLALTRSLASEWI